MINQDGLGGIKDKFREANPDSLAFSSTSSLNLSGDALVGVVIAVHTVDPNNGDVFTRRNGGRHQNGGGTRSCSGNRHNFKKALHNVLLIINYC